MLAWIAPAPRAAGRSLWLIRAADGGVACGVSVVDAIATWRRTRHCPSLMEQTFERHGLRRDEVERLLGAGLVIRVEADPEERRG